MAFTLEIDPSWDWQRYLLMKGIDYRSGDSIGFMEGPCGPDDMRFLFSTGPFSLEPEDVKEFAFVIVLAYDTISIAYRANEARRFWEEQIGVREGSASEMTGHRIVTITRGRLSIGSADRIEILDPLGRSIMRINSPSEEIGLDLLPQGVYFMVLKEGERFSHRKILIVR